MKNKCVPFLCKTQQGFGIVKALVSIPLVLIGLAILAFVYTELNKIYWDYRVKELCKKDGGVTVYETVELTQEEYIRNNGKNGFISVPSEKSNKNQKFDFLQKRNRTTLKKSDPAVWKTKTLIYRKSNESILGKIVTFTRRGGGFPTGITHSSSFTCRDIDGFETDGIKKIFIFKGDL